MIQIEKQHLLSACKHLRKAVNTRSIPALACVHIEPGLHETRLTTANLEQAVVTSLPAAGSKLAALRAKNAGPFLVDAGVLANAAKAADAGTFLQIDRDSIQLTIGGQVSTVPVTMLCVTEFPPLPEVDWMPVGGQIDLDALKRLMRCASTEETRYVLNGIYWDKEGLLIATDGRRLHSEPFVPLEEGVIIPSAACRMIPPRAAISLERPSVTDKWLPIVDLEKLPDGSVKPILGKPSGSGPQELKPSRHIAFVATENILTIRIFSKLVEGNYPKWRQVMPVPDFASHSVRFNNQDAAANLRKINKLAAGRKRVPGRRRAGRVESTRLDPSPGLITFHLQKDGVMIGSFTQPAVLVGNPEKIAFSTEFLIDALENGGDTFCYANEMSPARITGVKQNTHVLMPMRLVAAEPEPEPAEAEVDEEQYYAAHEP